MKKYKLLFCSLGLFFPGTGLNCFYLQGFKSFWGWAQLVSFLGGIAGWWILKDAHFHSAPGWVLITMMTAGLVVAIWAIAAPALGTVFDQAISRVVAF